MSAEGLVARILEAPYQGVHLVRSIPSDHHGLAPDMVRALKAQIDCEIRRDPRRALALAESAMALADKLGHLPSYALALLSQAHALRFLGDHHRALDAYDAAYHIYRRSGMPVEAARTAIGRIDALMSVGRYDEAISVARSARPVFLRHGEPLRAAALDLNLGNVYWRLGRFPESLRAYQRARQVFLRAGSEQDAAGADMNIANVLTSMDRFREALDVYARAKSTFARLGMRATVAMVDANMGYLHFAQGHYRRALQLLLSARDTFRDLRSECDVAMTSLDIVEVYLALGLQQEAAPLAQELSETFAGLGMGMELGRSLLYSGLARRREEAGRQSLARARKVFQEQGSDLWAATAMVAEASIVAETGATPTELAAALDVCRESGRLFARRRLPARVAHARLVEARLLERVEDRSSARRLYTSVLKVARRLDSPRLLFPAYWGLARLQRKERPASARRAYSRALDELERVLVQLPGDELRFAFLGDKLQVYEETVALLLEMGGPRRVCAAFETAERAKSRALLEMLSGALEVLPKGGTPATRALAQRLAERQEELRWYRGRLEKAAVENGGTADSAYLRGEVLSREKEVQSLLRELSFRGDEYAELMAARPVALQDVQAALGPGRTLLEYFRLDDEVMAFLVDSDRVVARRHLCSVASLERIKDGLSFHLGTFRYGREYVSRHSAALLDLSHRYLGRLYDALIRPLELDLRTQDLVVVPHGLMHALPFHAFWDGSSYLLDSRQVTYAPSAGVFKACLDRSRAGAGRPLVVAVPDQGLPWVRTEAEVVGSLLPGARVLMGESATCQAVARLAPHTALLHLASHAQFRGDNPFFSAIRLADGWLSLLEVYNLQLSASLVVLSGCETGLGRPEAGDDLVGLTRGFIYAGARSVIASLWAVQDETTAHLMGHFYRHVQDGLPSSAALRRAQMALRERYPHPYYWAPFFLVGRPD